MKKKHTLENGTVLEVGEKYCLKEWDEGDFIEITALGNESFLYLNENGSEDLEAYMCTIFQDLIPYQELKEKDLERLTAYVQVFYSSHIINRLTEQSSETKLHYVLFLGWFMEKPSIHHVKFNTQIVTIEEAKQRGLNINF